MIDFIIEIIKPILSFLIKNFREAFDRFLDFLFDTSVDNLIENIGEKLINIPVWRKFVPRIVVSLYDFFLLNACLWFYSGFGRGAVNPLQAALPPAVLSGMTFVYYKNILKYLNEIVDKIFKSKLNTVSNNLLQISSMLMLAFFPPFEVYFAASLASGVDVWFVAVENFLFLVITTIFCVIFALSVGLMIFIEWLQSVGGWRGSLGLLAVIVAFISVFFLPELPKLAQYPMLNAAYDELARFRPIGFPYCERGRCVGGG